MSYLVFPNAIERPNHEGLGLRVWIIYAKKYVEDIGNIMTKFILIFFQSMNGIRGQ
jgi:hypothetical protein